MAFKDRVDAGKQLAQKLAEYKKDNPVILAIPRGGVVVAGEIAKAFDTCVRLIIPRKIGAPHNPELAIGAVAGDGSVVYDEELIAALHVSPGYFEKEKSVQMQEIRRRMEEYGSKPVVLEGRTVIIVDDGIATGATMQAAIMSVKKENPKRIVVAVPVAPVDMVEELGKDVDTVVAIYVPEYFRGVSELYEHFPQTCDDEVKRILEKYR